MHSHLKHSTQLSLQFWIQPVYDWMRAKYSKAPWLDLIWMIYVDSQTRHRVDLTNLKLDPMPVATYELTSDLLWLHFASYALEGYENTSPSNHSDHQWQGECSCDSHETLTMWIVKNK